MTILLFPSAVTTIGDDEGKEEEEEKKRFLLIICNYVSMYTWDFRIRNGYGPCYLVVLCCTCMMMMIEMEYAVNLKSSYTTTAVLLHERYLKKLEAPSSI